MSLTTLVAVREHAGLHMSWIDLSLPIHPEMLTYAGDPPMYRWQSNTAEQGRPDSYGFSWLGMCSHTGTHVDAPSHFVPGGASIDQVPLEVLCGTAEVVDLSAAGQAIGPEQLARHVGASTERLLLKTRNSALLDRPFTEDFAHLTAAGAEWLRDHGIRLVGIDYLSVEAPDSEGFPVHHTLLGADPPVIIVEGLDLRQVAAGRYELCVLPLRVQGADGAPARAMVRPLG